MDFPISLVRLNRAREVLAEARADLAAAIAALNQFVGDDGTLTAFDHEDITQENANDYLAAINIVEAFDRIEALKQRIADAAADAAHWLQVARNEGHI